MLPESFSPEQRAKFMTESQINSLGDMGGPEKPVSPITPAKFRKSLPIIFGILGAAIIVFAGARFFVNNGVKELLSPLATGAGKLLGPTYTNPLTGEIVKEEQAAAYKTERPIGVMINNHTAARPQSGLIDADLVYEIVAEGGITRFLAFFLSTLPDKIGPVRSTREYYLVLVKELSDAMVMHIGWSPQALEAIETWPVRSLGRGGAEFWRDQNRLNNGIPTEHTAYVDGKYLRELGDQLGWQGNRAVDVWKFKDDGPIDTSQQCLVGECDKPVKIDFWYAGDYTGLFKYDRNSNSYLRFSGYDEAGAPIALVDQESQKQVAVKNLIVQFVTETSISGDDKNRLEYQLVGSGEAVVFLDGKATPAIWKKEGRDIRTKFYDTSGNEIVFNRGKIWVSIVPDRNKEQVTY